MAAIPGIGFRNGLSPYLHPGYAFLEKLDELPMPARDLVDNARYVIDGRRYTMLLTSRGCPHACGFCALSATPCATYRVRPPEKVLAEITHCRQHYGITHFDIEDDNFTADRRHAATILDGVTAMTDVSLSAMNGLSACNLTPSILDAMRLAGFSHLDLALVTNNPDSRKLVSRPGSLSQFGDILREAGRRHFKTTVHIILGLPEDTTANMIQTLAYLMAQPCLIGANIYYPVPGSTLFTQYQEHIRYQSPPFWRSTLASCESYPGQRDEYMTLFYLARVINYVKRLLTRLDRTDSRLPLQEVSGLLFRELVPAATRALIAENEISQARRWTADTLGIFMLQRFCDTRRLEKVQVRKENAGIIYSFTDEFNCREVLEQFWAKAVSTPLAAG
jgi:radical SAM superfamily enzyme YgiQ (UPF0313 family)